MTLYLIGLGLNDEKDITLKGLDAVNKADFVYLENYTSKLNYSVRDLEKLYGRKIILADRELVEKNAEEILEKAKKTNVAFLVVGDVFSATTHIDLMLRARKEKIDVKVVNNASVLTAVGITGLQLYKFGKVTSIPSDNKNIKTPIEVFNFNYKNGLHTLFLLDPDGMTINKAVEYLLRNNVDDNLLAVGCTALGSEKPEIKKGKLKDLLDIKFKKFPQCLIVPGKLHFMEEEALELY